jgi:predicted AAA+ superfamily ATPase
MSLAERGIQTPTVSLGDLLTGPSGQTVIDGETTLTAVDYAREVAASGFPDVRNLSPRARTARLEGYIHNIVQRAFPEQGLLVRKPQVLRSWMLAYAAATSLTTSYSGILDAATPGESDKAARTTVQAYRDTLASLWMLDPIPAWTPSRNRLNRLGAAPKHQLADPALAAHLLGVDENALIGGVDTRMANLREGTLFGALFEHLVALSVLTYALVSDAQVGHLRTAGGGHEVDLIVERRDGRLVAVEIKLTTAPTDRDVRHLLWLAGQLPDQVADLVVVTTGRHAYRRRDGVAVVPAALLGP